MFELPRGFSDLRNASRTEVEREYCDDFVSQGSSYFILSESIIEIDIQF